MAALYSIYDLEQALEDNISNYVRVEIDGEDVGIAYRIDLLYVLKEKYRSLSTARKKSSRITSVKIYGKDHTVDHCVRIYNAKAEDMFRENELKENRRREIEKERELAASEAMLDRYSGGVSIANFLDIPMSKAKDLTLKDTIQNRVSISRNNQERSNGRNRGRQAKVKCQKEGFFARIKRWLKGDKGYKR